MSTSVSTPPHPLTQHPSIETKQIPEEPSSSDFVVSTPTEAKLENIEAHKLNKLTTDQLENRVLVDKLQSNSIAQMDKPRPQELVKDAVKLPNPEVHTKLDTINTSMIAKKLEQEMPTQALIVQETQTDKLSSMKPQNNPSMSKITSTNIQMEIQQVKKTLRHAEKQLKEN
jgi:hypothetical protein